MTTFVNRSLRVIQCGLITGVLWSLSQMLFVFTAIEIGLLSKTLDLTLSGTWHFLLDILSGILALAAYVLLRAFSWPIPRAVSIPAVCWLVVQILSGLTEGGFEFTVAQSFLVYLLAFFSLSLSILAGAWPYEVMAGNDQVAFSTTKVRRSRQPLS
jgi:hypothetical protein